MEKTMKILLFMGLIALLSCSIVSARRQGKKDFCQLSKERGHCKASISKWYYDSSVGICKNFTYGGCGGNANRFISKSICERVCKPGCRYERCSNTCPHGFIIDSDGCNTCRCQPASEQSPCPAIECTNSCPNGYQTDSDGCMTCDCKTEQVQARATRTRPKHQCPPVCYMYCQFGNKQDENGCDICACKSEEEVCGSQQCMTECPTGFVTDGHGCKLCECNSASARPACPTNQCLKECQFGFQKDSFGCEICACATRRTRNRQGSACSNRPTCRMNCPNGFLKGRDGCDICRCAVRTSERRIARNERPFNNGSSSEDVCGVRPMCTMFCSEGFKKDGRGCVTCACEDAPPQAAQLPADNSAESAAQLPANIPSQLPAQLPADTPSQLPSNSGCLPKRCHKNPRVTSCSFGFIKDEFGCDTCVCNTARSSAASQRRNS